LLLTHTTTNILLVTSGVTIQTLAPGMIRTKMLNSFLTPQPTESEIAQHRQFSVLPEAYVSYAINTIGWEDECDGHPKHFIIRLLLKLIL